MRRLIHLKYFTLFLLVVMLTVTINGVHVSAHAMQNHVTVSSDQASPVQISAAHNCPCSPLEHHEEDDCCDACINCVCHAPLIIQQFLFSFTPSILELSASDPFKYLPEVYLSKFIPPHILV